MGVGALISLIRSSRLGSDNATTPVPSFLLVHGALHLAGVQLRMLRIPMLTHSDSILLRLPSIVFRHVMSATDTRLPRVLRCTRWKQSHSWPPLQSPMRFPASLQKSPISTRTEHSYLDPAGSRPDNNLILSTSIHSPTSTMSIPSTPSSLTVPTMRHKGYFIHEADLTIRVESYMFRVHRYFLERESAYFRLRLEKSSHPQRDPPGSSESNPLVLDDATGEGFARFLWVFYNPKYSVYKATPEEWSSILDLAQKWGFKQVEELCIRELERLALSPVDRIHIYQQHKLDPTLLLGSFESLCTRDEPIEVEEGIKLGLQTSVQIASAREKSRRPDSPHITRLLSDIFHIQTNGAANAGPFTAPLDSSGKLDRASALPATVRSTSASEANPPTTDIIPKTPQPPPEVTTRRGGGARAWNNSNRP